MSTPPRRGRGDVALAVVVVAVVAMMLVPLPAAAIDVLLAVSLTSAVVILLSAVYAPSPARLTTLPTLVLLATLFRLGLNVSTTRRILAEGDGGEVVRAFGSFVARGDLVVGLVVFAVIAIVQYLVVARGAERVAEVAARFALDGLPGKQLAIDGDLRAGAIDAAEAARRRAALESQSQLYGALDGAMKFVKGDVIAAILIVVVNLAGGMLVGMGERGLGAGEAASIYAIQAIGDGLVVQVPALLVALAAALVVTRVAAADGERPIGDEIGRQLAAQPRAFFTAAGLLALLGVVPGLPAVPFLVLAILAAAVGLVAARAPVRRDDGAVLAEALGPPASAADAGIELAVGAALGARLRADGALGDALARGRERLHEKLGVRAPTVRLRVDPDVRGDEVELRLWGVTVDWLTPAPTTAGLQAALEPALARHAAELVRASVVAAQLDELGAAHAPLVRDVVPRVAALPLLVEVLRRLVREGVSIRDLPAVLEALALAPASGPRDAAMLAEHARGHLGRVVTGAIAPRGQLDAWTLDPLIEDAVRGALVTRDGSAIVALEPGLARDVVAAVRAQVGERGVVLASGDVRRHLKSVLDPELPGIAVVAPHELGAGVTVRSRGRIDVA
jgi:type III secretion protein V